MDRVVTGRRIVVTRSRAQAAQLRALLEREGAEVIDFPTIRLLPPSDYAPVDRAIASLGEYRWVVFTSQNGVMAFTDRMRALGWDPHMLRGARLAAIGPGTARALEAQGLRVDLAPAEFRAEALVAAFEGQDLRGARVLLPRAADARGVLPEGLRHCGAAVDVVAVYRTELEREHSPEVRRRLLAGTVDAVAFTSASTVRNFVALLHPDAQRVLAGVLVACIGPVTADAARDLGLTVGVIARTYTIPGLVAALRSALGSGTMGAPRGG
jgi:uroporphyrinogen III methyltransferase/synthase